MPWTNASAPVYEANGTYAAGIGLSKFLDACSLSGKTNDLFSSCRSVDGFNVDGLLAKVRDESLSAPLTQGLRLCYYSAFNYMLDCPPNEGCSDTSWTWCAHVSPGTKLVGIASISGVNVNWHVVIG